MAMVAMESKAGEGIQPWPEVRILNFQDALKANESSLELSIEDFLGVAFALQAFAPEAPRPSIKGFRLL